MDRITRNSKKWLSKLRDSRRRLLWFVTKGTATETTPVFIVGSQRSGTGMLGECLGKSPQFENLGESDQRAFRDYSLLGDDIICRLVNECRCRFIVFKPLKDSHRVRELLSLDARARAIWAYRNYVDRINSAVRKFGRHPLDVFEAFQSGDLARWQTLGISNDTAKVLRRMNLRDLTEQDGAALMWWVRNSLFFDQALQHDERVRLWSYDEFVAKPEAGLKSLLEFLGATYLPYMLEDVHSQSLGKERAPPLNPDIRSLCDSLFERLEVARKIRMSVH